METIDSAPWRKSSYSGTSGGDCVEAADMDGRILVRDTTNRSGVVLNISPARGAASRPRSCSPATPRSSGAALGDGGAIDISRCRWAAARSLGFPPGHVDPSFAGRARKVTGSTASTVSRSPSRT